MKIFLFNFIQYFSIFFHISCQIYSITQNSVNVSKYSLDLVNNDFFSKPTFKYKNYYANSQQINVDLNTNKAIFTFTKTNEYGYAKNELYEVYFNGQKNRGKKNFYTQYADFAYPAKRIDAQNSTEDTNNSIESNKLNDENEKYMCHNLLGNITFKVGDNISATKFAKVLTMKRAIFGLDTENNKIFEMNKIYKYYYSKNKTNYYHNFYNEIQFDCKSGKILDFFIHNDVMAKLILLEDKTYNLCIDFYNFIDIVKNKYFEYNRYLNKNLDFKSKVLDFKFKKDFIYVSLENEKKIIRYKKETLEIDQIFTNDLIKNDLIKFVVLEQTIYAIEKDVGLVVFDLNYGGIVKIIEIPYAIDLDLFKNPFNGFLFIGIYLNSQYDDFFIELFINNEKNPSLNKVLAYNYLNQTTYSNFHYKFSHYITFDAHFTYFLDIANNNLISIKRGLINEIDFISFVIPLNSSFEEDSMIYPYRSSNYFEFGLYSKNKYIMFDTFTYRKNQLFCNFNDKKIYYSLLFSHKTDQCPFERNDKSPLLCKIIDGYSFKVYVPLIKSKAWVTMLLSLFTLSFTVLIILIVILYRSANEKDLGLNIYRNFDINNRKTLYFGSDDFNFNANERIQSNEFKDNDIYENDRRLSNLYKHYDAKKKTNEENNNILNKLEIPDINFSRETEKTESDDQKVVNISINLMEDSKEKIIHKKKK